MGLSHSKSLIINNNQLNLPNTIVKQILGLVNSLRVALVCKYWFIYLIPESVDKISCNITYFENIIRNYPIQVKSLYSNHLTSSISKKNKLNEINKDDNNNSSSKLKEPDRNLKFSIFNLTLQFDRKFKYNFDKSILHQSNFSNYLNNLRVLTLSNIGTIKLNEFFQSFKESTIKDHDRLTGLHLVDLLWNGPLSNEIVLWINNQSKLEEFSFKTSHFSKGANRVPLPCISPLLIQSLYVSFQVYDKVGQTFQVLKTTTTPTTTHTNNNNNNDISIEPIIPERKSNLNSSNESISSSSSRSSIEIGKNVMPLPFYENLKRLKVKVEKYDEPDEEFYELQIDMCKLTHLTFSGVYKPHSPAFLNRYSFTLLPSLIHLQYLKISRGYHETSFDMVDILIDRIQHLPNLTTFKLSSFPMSNQQIVRLVNFPSSKITKFSFHFVSLGYTELFKAMLPSYTTLPQYYNITTLSLDFNDDIIESITNLLLISTTIEKIKLFFINTPECTEISNTLEYYQSYSQLIIAINSSKSLRQFEIPYRSQDTSLKSAIKKVPFNNPNVILKSSILKNRIHMIERSHKMVAM